VPRTAFPPRALVEADLNVIVADRARTHIHASLKSGWRPISAASACMRQENPSRRQKCGSMETRALHRPSRLMANHRPPAARPCPFQFKAIAVT